MIINKEQIDVVRPDRTMGKNLVVSYVNKEGQIEYLNYPIPADQMFIWKYAGRRTDADPVWKSWDNKWVKRYPTDELPEHRVNELLCSFGTQVDPLWEINAPKTAFSDIEVNVEDGFPEADTALQPINTIANTIDDDVIVWGRTPLTDVQIESIQKNITDYTKQFNVNYHFVYKYFPDDRDLLMSWLVWLKDVPCITGWNFLGYDWYYVMTRCKNLGIDPSFISPTGHMDNYRMDNKFGKVSVQIPKHKLVYDYMLAYKKWDKSVKIKENNTLDFVSESVLKIKKVTHNMGFKEFWETDPENYVFYNAIDTILVQLIDKKIKTSKIMYSLAANLKIECLTAFSPVKSTEIVLGNFIYGDHKVFPVAKKNIVDADYEGAYVFPAKAGIYKYIGGLDFASLYPTIIRQFNISPENYLMKDKNHIPKPNEVKCTSGAVFDNTTRGMLPRVLDYYYAKRKEAKNQKKQANSEMETLKHILQKRKAEQK